MVSKQQQASEQLADFKPWPEWLLAKKGGKVLESPGSYQWFVRKHRKRLIAEGQLIVRRGPGGHFVGPKFDELVLQILREESAANV